MKEKHPMMTFRDLAVQQFTSEGFTEAQIRKAIDYMEVAFPGYADRVIPAGSVEVCRRLGDLARVQWENLPEFEKARQSDAVMEKYRRNLQ